MLGLHHVESWDRAIILKCNRINKDAIGALFAVVSRLGDGWFWFLIMFLLPMIHGIDAISISVGMLLTGACATIIYKLIKNATHRLRPCEKNSGLLLTVTPLDRYSFPSGHTLHAVCFTVIACGAYPEWSWLLIPFTFLVGLSRLVLGLHYLSDVLIGALIGGTLGCGALVIIEKLP